MVFNGESTIATHDKNILDVLVSFGQIFLHFHKTFGFVMHHLSPYAI